MGSPHFSGEIYMLRIVSLIILMIAGILFYPQFNEDADSSCSALEKRGARLMVKDGAGLDLAIAGLLLRGLSNGMISRELIKSEYPNLPPIIGCSFYYYRVILDPGFAKDIESKLKNS